MSSEAADDAKAGTTAPSADTELDAASTSMSEGSEGGGSAHEAASGSEPASPEAARAMERLESIGARVDEVEGRTARMPAAIASKAAHVIAMYWRRVTALHTGAAEEAVEAVLAGLPAGEDKSKAAAAAWGMPKPVMLSTSALAYGCAGDAEAFMKALMDLDAVESHGDGDVRAARKALVKRVHGLLERADAVTARAKRVVQLSEALARRLEAEATKAGIIAMVDAACGAESDSEAEAEAEAPVAPEAEEAAAAADGAAAADLEAEAEADEDEAEADEAEDDEEEDVDEEDEDEEDEEEEDEDDEDVHRAPAARRVYYDAFGRPVVVSTGVRETSPRAHHAKAARAADAADADALAARRLLAAHMRERAEAEARVRAQAQARARAEAEARARARALAEAEAEERARALALRRLRAAQAHAAAQQRESCHDAYTARHLGRMPQHAVHSPVYDDVDDGYGGYGGYGWAAPRAPARSHYHQRPSSTPYGYAPRGRGFAPSVFDMVW